MPLQPTFAPPSARGARPKDSLKIRSRRSAKAAIWNAYRSNALRATWPAPVLMPDIMPRTTELLHIKDLWDERQERELADDRLGQLRYRSNLLGADLRITNF